jgi:aminotransferase
MGLECFPPEGAFYVFPSIQRYGLSSEEFCLALLKEAKVVLIPGSAFGDSREGFVRISYAYSLADLRLALDRLEAYLKKRN